ncbi:hypothetical protein [Bosea sp. PAMC 26642]|uniref:hypothetical protein n=1 Tax=Bosea sp. (strain PAMC 26642) TaxID=1792307 RepID=UPI000770488F|nr:hypothetical protein [Bosea sp. PAMC 26642]AMJ63260.1 hypothetical protein AXW83_25780 [Bosea sp. PAMC 26642]
MTAQLSLASFAPVANMTSSMLSLAENQLLELDGAVDDIAEDDDDGHDANLVAHSALVEMSLALPAETDADRAAQVRILLNHVMPASWLGDDEDLDWHNAMARRLLLKFAGLNPMIDPTSGE